MHKSCIQYIDYSGNFILDDRSMPLPLSLPSLKSVGI